MTSPLLPLPIRVLSLSYHRDLMRRKFYKHYDHRIAFQLEEDFFYKEPAIIADTFESYQIGFSLTTSNSGTNDVFFAHGRILAYCILPESV